MRRDEEESSMRGQTSAYPFAADRYKYPILMIVSLLTMVWVKAAVYRDYRSDAEIYLRAHGREDALDQVIPLSSSELLAIEKETVEKEKLEKAQKAEDDKNTIDKLVTKTTDLAAKLTLLEKESKNYGSVDNGVDNTVTADIKVLEERISKLEETKKTGGVDDGFETRWKNSIEQQTSHLKALELKVSNLEEKHKGVAEGLGTRWTNVIEIIEQQTSQLKSLELKLKSLEEEQNKEATQQGQLQQQQPTQDIQAATQPEDKQVSKPKSEDSHSQPQPISKTLDEAAFISHTSSTDTPLGESSNSFSRDAMLAKRAEVEKLARIRKRIEERQQREVEALSQ